MAAHHRVGHFIAYLDYNKYQLDDATKVICDLEPLVDKWKAFGWYVLEIDGHSFEAILQADKEARTVQNQPVMIIAHTVKGKGVSFMENNNHYHGVAPTPEEAARALEELSD